jgi:hypothetical protein
MIYLIQLYKMVEDKKLFIAFYSDIEGEAQELGYDSVTEFVQDTLETSFGLTIECPEQCESIARAMLKKHNMRFLENMVG